MVRITAIFVSKRILFFILRKCWRRFDFWIWLRHRFFSRLWSYTLMGEMWYFGGYYTSQIRQVWIVYIHRILNILFRLVKSKVANWSDKEVCLLIFIGVHATHFLNQRHGFFFASPIQLETKEQKHATRKFYII